MTCDLTESLDRLAESLKHPKHAVKLDPIRRDAAEVLGRWFRRQQSLLLRTLQPHLTILADRSNVLTPEGDSKVREADQESKDAVKHVIPDAMLLPVALTSGMASDYSRSLQSALEAGYDGLATDTAYTGEVAEDVVLEYLKDHSLSKLTGGIDATSVKRLQNALADAYEAGEDYSGLVDAVKNEFSEFSSVRAGLISQTEMNDAYNAGRRALADDANFNEKSWSCDGPNPCAVCLLNQAQGWIPIEEPFASGDDIATSHPGCYCSNDYRLKS